uniref:Arb2 domain-containing protein n=1 Tax=Pavo cristatus TaxID=9049 RepID=A0A8C9G1I0_PAVCR
MYCCCKWNLAFRAAVIVLNPNDSLIDLKTEREKLSFSTREESLTSMHSCQWIPRRCSSSPEEHTMYNVAFIAHGYGGLVFTDLLMQRKWEVMNKVLSVAFIDSMHNIQHQARNDPQIQWWIQKHCREWVSNNKPLGKAMGSLVKVNCPTVSAGTEKYSLAPSYCLRSIFKYLNRTLKAKATTAITRSPIRTRSTKSKKVGK